MILKGLNIKGTFAMDNTFRSEGGVWTNYGTLREKWISPEGDTSYNQQWGATKYDYVTPAWTVRTDNMLYNQTERKTYYQAQINYANSFGKNNITAMGLFSRDKWARGNQFPNYREDWVFRTTYNFASRYYAEFNGAYNGSEKFGPKNRFDFFPSGGLTFQANPMNSFQLTYSRRIDRPSYQDQRFTVAYFSSSNEPDKTQLDSRTEDLAELEDISLARRVAASVVSIVGTLR